ncbi:hypothetical protein D3C78_1605210 [compost metagenome]
MRLIAVTDHIGNFRRRVFAAGHELQSFAATGFITQGFEFDTAILETTLQGSRGQPDAFGNNGKFRLLRIGDPFD